MKGNNTTRIRREIMIRLAKAFFLGKQDDINRIPYEMRPLNSESSRCCIYMDRAVIRYRCMAAMGHAVESEKDDSIPLSVYADQALARKLPPERFLTVLSAACRGCGPAGYYVTDACQGCVARPCAENCPFGAITFEKGRAFIDSDKCRNCGKCASLCPYHAITRISLPCEEACPVEAIRKNGSNRAEIDFDKCISCGKCFFACPFGAVMERSQLVDVIKSIKSETKTVAMIAPSITGQFPGSLGQIKSALLILGFDQVKEVALGAEETIRHEALEFTEKIGEKQAFMTTSCCPAYTETVRKHVPELKKFLSDARSPMHYTGKMVKETLPDSVTVFIGPCVAKRAEARQDPYTDYVLTFEETGTLLVAAGIDSAQCLESNMDRPASREARAFPVTGSVSAAVKSVLEHRGVSECRPMTVDGLSPREIKRLHTFAKGSCPANLVEVMACEGGCVAGPGILASPGRAKKANIQLCNSSVSISETSEKKVIS